MLPLFANRPEDVEQAFQQYYEASVSEPTDPDLLFDREREVMAYQLLVEAEMDAFVTAYFAAFQGGSATDTAIMKAHARLYGYLQDPAM
ncbi:hypothetical protein [Streptomyces sp.]|uniref:hypothetical protein n=1 Tax=Streptomyces sp. TaxID=1931 RepID=UPI002F94F03C